MKMLEVKIWVLIGALAVTTTVIGFLGKAVANSILNKMDEMVRKLDSLITTSTTHQQQISQIQKQQEIFDKRLNNYSERLRELEIEFSKRKPS